MHEHQRVGGDIWKVAGDIRPRLTTVGRLEDVPDTAAGDPASRIAVENGVRVSWVRRIDGDTGDIAARQSGRVDLVPGAAVVGCDPRGEGRPRVAPAPDP